MKPKPKGAIRRLQEAASAARDAIRKPGIGPRKDTSDSPLDFRYLRRLMSKRRYEDGSIGPNPDKKGG